MTMLRSLAAVALAATTLSLSVARADEALRIGAPLPITGALAPEGAKLKQGYELWQDKVNAAGGIKAGGKTFKVELVYYDYQSTTPKAVQLAEKLISDDKVDFLFSPFGSGAAKAVSAVAEKYGVPLLASSASSAEVFDQGYKNLFGLYTDNSTLSEPIADLIKAKLPTVKRVAILARNDLYPLSLGNEFEKSAKKRGFEVVYFEKYPIGTLDHSSALTQLRAAKPDWVVVTGYINDLILVRKQAGELKVGGQIYTLINGPAYQEWIDAVGPLAENVTTASWFHPVLNYKSEDVFGSTRAFVDQFKAKYGSEPDFTQASGAAVGVILQQAVERAGSKDRAAVREQLVKGGFKTFFAPVSFGPTGIANSYVPPVYQIQQGKVQVVYPADIATGEFRAAPAN
ncbi:amino acid ABC transporter substrate-binding protein [Bradyrhizobium sp. U87765 SZCCT0131]|uniref:amino acid ABC transporter substrate-binding protein n=1 Tax=unclassified Bradyrhizobium TaxID=2631580 RepID=UPI001BA7C870|nr:MULTISPECIES: amino acid ABC transporter substrate-binding protein [unclassified Bradyrhizobium]MBR1218893.1 amino acid ABC transporter substrate-binding protein [Bradyrhizobium sp. U87765 SZCCT0131]MBR1261544.1 amino acid ABC transporter substrate-binding protein [Bradyrhizobium sp. U87765 SZCCT0134]MBR1306603.1 amino acid ABC transporter substrate-binding protein [Bradyrhizobium sp. U87765 SZCCT0110]MBR1317326.1 amino acid ABC transporter substrate-binding protein [Bradyrhizobium sp. U8776